MGKPANFLVRKVVLFFVIVEILIFLLTWINFYLSWCFLSA